MNITPLSDRVLIKPDAPPTQTESGLHLVQHYTPDLTGTVVAVGYAKHPRKDEAFEIAALIDPQHGGPTRCTCELCDAAALLRDLTRKEPSVKVGDYVVFSYSSGQSLVIDDERYVLMRESEILAIVEMEPV